jgi:antitoxin component YwqK of YwqJK toxin-antitoxin module
MEAAHKDGKLEGRMTYYHPNGMIRLSGLYKNDVREGPWNTYEPGGKLKETETFKKGISDKEKEIILKPLPKSEKDILKNDE